ncbi:MAG: helix-turn-helix domain-containing protein [Marinifilaceae bacterium]
MKRRNKADLEQQVQNVQEECDFYIEKLEDVDQARSLECQKKFQGKELYGMVFQFGGSGVHFIDCKKYELTGNAVSFLSPGQVHTFELRNSGGYLVRFNSNIFQQSTDNRKLYDYPFFHTTLGSSIMGLPDEFPCLVFLLESMYKEFKQSCFKREDHLESSLKLLMIELERLYKGESSGESGQKCEISDRIRKLETLIDEYYRENRSVSFYAEKLHLSSRHLNNIIKESGCNSVSNLIQKRVLLEAKRLLLHSNLTVTEISDQLNFSDKAYFHRYFKTQTGRTPEQFRQEFLKVH